MNGQQIPEQSRTLPALLDWGASEYGDAVLVRTESETRTFVEMRDAVAASAGRFAAAGIKRGERVAIMSENRLEMLDLWLGAAWLGAIAVPVNTALRGNQLQHVLTDSGARLLVIEASLISALDSIETPSCVSMVWALPVGESATPAGVTSLPSLGGAAAVGPASLLPGDPAVILYTSGTTGPAKGVTCPHGQWYRWGVCTTQVVGVVRGDVLYSCLPLFHSNALNTFVQGLLAGATFVPGPRFSASRFWQRVVDAEATVTYLMGTMVSILANRESDPREREHSIRVALAPATPAKLHDAFHQRFGIEIVDGWGSTETNFVLSTAVGPAPPGSMGGVLEGFEARVVDVAGQEVIRAGVPGELIVRSDDPHGFSSGYHALPAETSAAWKDGWFHTGDRVFRDADGWFWFRDRIKDSIRRRGENVSSYEVEVALQTHPDVTDVAVVAVPSSLGEDDVMAYVVARDGVSVEANQLIQHLDGRLAYFAIPRYIEFLDELPITPNGKVEKYKLRSRGLSSNTWDREHPDVSPERLRASAPSAKYDVASSEQSTLTPESS